MFYFSRVVIYPSGSLFGTVLFTVGTPHMPLQLTLDNSGNIYISSSGGIYRLSRDSAFPKSIIAMWGYGGSKIQLDTAGTIYTSTYNGMPNMVGMSDIGSIIKYNLISNAC
jgi:hypothetical protein